MDRFFQVSKSQKEKRKSQEDSEKTAISNLIRSRASGCLRSVGLPSVVVSKMPIKHFETLPIYQAHDLLVVYLLPLSINPVAPESVSLARFMAVSVLVLEFLCSCGKQGAAIRFKHVLNREWF